MHCTGATTLSLLAALAAGVLAGDLVQEIQRDFRMGLFARQTGTNIQPFTGALGGPAAPPITQSDDEEKPFEVDGEALPDFQTAVNKSCDKQKNECADLANSDESAGFEVGDCDQQNEDCKNAGNTATQTAFPELFSSNAEFDFFCDP